MAAKLVRPFVAAPNGLTLDPVIKAIPQAAAAVSDAKSQAETGESTGGVAAAALVADAQAFADPPIAACDRAIIAAADALLLKSLGEASCRPFLNRWSEGTHRSHAQRVSPG